MRLIVGISLLLLGIGTLSCRVDSTMSSLRPAATPMAWVRTTDGWEHPEIWFATPARPPQLHPLVVAAGQCLASLLALTVFRREGE